METLQDEDLRMTFEEFCTALLIVGHLYHKKLTLYQEFSLVEAIDDFLHHLLNRFAIDSNPLYRKRLEKMMKMNFESNFTKTDSAQAPGDTKQSSQTQDKLKTNDDPNKKESFG